MASFQSLTTRFLQHVHRRGLPTVCHVNMAVHILQGFHFVQILMSHGRRATVRAANCQNIPKIHLRLEQEHWKQVEADAKARAAHLRASDFNAYLDEVEKQGDEHVDKLLQDSNSCLIKILTRLQKSGVGGTLAQISLTETIPGRQLVDTRSAACTLCTVSSQPEPSLTLSPCLCRLFGVHLSATLSTQFSAI